jgi:hypothetical protein
MSTAITRIQLKYSTGTAAPTSLATGEPAYSYASNTFFIGSPTGDGVIAIGGKFYLDQQQLAWNHANSAFTAANNAVDPYVRNHANAAFDTANGAVAVNLTQNNSITAAFNTGNSAFIQANSGFNHANAAFNSSNTINGVNLTQNNSITFASDTANAAYANANSYITRNEAVNVSQNNRIDAAYTRANNSLSANNGGTVTGDVSITGNLIVTGNVISISTTEIVANDSLIILGLGNYISDIVDIGFAGHYNDGVNAHAGIIRDSTNKEFYVFDGYTPEIGANNNINPSDPSFRLATVNANVKAQSIQIKGIDILPYANGIYNAANAAFTRANNSLNANTGGQVTGNISVGGSITPNADVTWNLGSASNRWHSLFVGAGTIDIGGLTISNTKVGDFDTANFGGVQDIKLTNAAVGSFRQVANTGNAAFNHANAVFANSNTYITYNEAVSVTQNNSIASSFNHANSAFANSNTYITYAEAVSVTQNTNITNAQNSADAAFSAANGAIAVNLTQNNSITVALNTANAAFANANSYITRNEAVNVTQNTNITNAQNSADAAFSTANGAVAVNLTQNNSITASFAHANAAFDKANNSTDLWVRNQANSAFDAANGAVAVNLTQNNSITVALNTANAAFAAANAATDTWVRGQANAAFTRANNSLDANNGGTITGDVIINANLFVNGTTTYVNTVNQLIGDNIITLNADIPQNGTPTQDSGFEVDRGIQPNSSFLWIESAGKFSANNGNTAFYVADERVAVGAYNHANAAFTAANNATDTYVRNHANAAFFHANSSFFHANAAYSTANSAASAASSAQGTADSAASAAIAAQYTGTSAFYHANAAFAQANTYATASASVFNTVGDGTTTSFNLGFTPVSDGSASVVSIDGIIQYEGTWSITTGNTSINFSDAPGAGERVRVLAYTSVNPYVLGATGVTAGSYGNANTIAAFTTAANGQLTFASNVAIAIGASQITSGILPVARGGTGAGTFTTNGVLLGQGTDAFQTASSSTEGHVLTINSSGVPVFSYINGGTF